MTAKKASKRGIRVRLGERTGRVIDTYPERYGVLPDDKPDHLETWRIEDVEEVE